MNDYYPPGVTELPEDQIYPCDKCNVKNCADDYIDCPSCGDMNLCTKCNTCNSCDIKHVTCECGSEELIPEDDECCSQCYDEEG